MEAELQQALVEMGFDAEASRAALEATGYAGLDEAASYLIGEPVVSSGEGEGAVHAFDPNPKMVIVMNCGLGMSTGKMAAQAAHAAVGLNRQLQESQSSALLLFSWMACGEPIIVVRVEDTAALATIKGAAEKGALSTYQVMDAGRTEIAPGSVTCCAVFGVAQQVDRVTGDLKLL